MRKKFLAGIFLITMLASMVLPFGIPKKAQAARFDEVFLLNQDNKPSESVFTPERYMTKDLRLEPKSKAKDGFQLIARMTLRGDDAKDSDEDDKFTKDDTKGAWDVVLDSDMGRSGENGIFLFVGKEKITVRNEDKSSPPDFDEYTDRVIGPRTARLQIPTSLQGAIKSSDIPYYSSDNVDQEIPGGEVNGLNIGPIIWEINPDIFFSNSRAPSPTITVTGLEPDTTYYAQLAAVEDKGTRIALSDILEVKTGSATDPAASDLGGTGLDAADQTDAPPPNGTPFGDQIYCFRAVTDLDLGGCIVIFWYNVVFTASSLIAQLTGTLFDVFVNVALSSDMYKEPTANFVVDGWAIVRDIANVFFIFILLYIALGLVLSLHHFDAKKLISKVIIVALLINFSLFFTRVVVDMSNILALTFYNSMTITHSGTTPEKVTKNSNEKSISLAVLKGIDPQVILSQKNLNAIGITKGTAFFLTTLIIILNLVLAWIFFVSAAFFAGRIGVIWLSMIFAPLALVSSIIPGLNSGLKQIGWSQWLSAFLKACFNAPIFVFFLYLIVRMTSTDVFGGLLSSSDQVGWVAIMIGVLLPAMILIGLLMAAKKIAEEMAGQFGAAFTGLINGAIGGTANVAMGGAAMLGRKLVGGAAAKTLQNQTLKDAASGDAAAMNKLYGKKYDLTTKDGMARAQKDAAGKLQRADKLSKASFDVRQTGAANMLSSVTGVNMNAGAGIIPGLGAFGVDNTAGGFAASQQRKVEKENAFKALLGQDDDKIHDKEHENEEIDQALIPHQEKLKKQEQEKTDAEDAIKEWKNENPNKPITDNPDLSTRLNKAKAAIKDTKENAVVRTASGTMYAGINGAEKNKKENEKDIEKLKTVRQKNYVKFLKDQAAPGDMVGQTSGNSAEARASGKKFFRSILQGMMAGAAGGAALGLGAGVGIGAIPLALVGTVPGAISGGALSGLKSIISWSTEKITDKLSSTSQQLGGIGDSLKGTRMRSANEEVAESVGHKEQHPQKFKATYKTPNSNFFKMFEGLGKSSGGGASHDAGGDHGGGGDHH